jgi:hypothetical protein
MPILRGKFSKIQNLISCALACLSHSYLYIICPVFTNPDMPLLFKALLHGQKDWVFSAAFNIHTKMSV